MHIANARSLVSNVRMNHHNCHIDRLGTYEVRTIGSDADVYKCTTYSV